MLSLSNPVKLVDSGESISYCATGMYSRRGGDKQMGSTQDSQNLLYSQDSTSRTLTNQP